MSMGNNLKNLLKWGPKNIKRRLLRDVLIIVIVTSSLLAGLMIYQSTKIKEKVARSIIVDTMALVKRQFGQFVGPIETSLELGAKWGKAGVWNDLDDKGLTKLLLPMLQLYPQIEAVHMANSKGGEFFLQRFGKNWRSRWVPSGRGPRTALWKLWEDSSGPFDSWWETTSYDPRLRPWFVKALSKGPGVLSWTFPYRLPYSGKIGVTAAISWSDPKSPGVAQVMAFDLLEEKLINYLRSLKVGKNRRIILVRSDGTVITTNQSKELLASGNNAPVIPIEEALRWWKGIKNKGEKDLWIMRFSRIDGTWWAGFTPLLESRRMTWIGVVIPESEITGSVKRGWPQLLFMALGVLLVGVLLTLELVRKYSYQLRDLPQKVSQSDFERDVLTLIEGGESATLEFKSTVRTNLKTGKKAKEIEFAWLKTVVGFMNTDGGMIVIGVDDNGEIVGIEADEFESEDRCLLHLKSLVNDHIGPEFSRFISFRLGTVKGKTVLVIECERVRKPVFLKIGKNEDFYIRTGPSTVKLTMSQMVDYLESRI